MLEVKVKKEDLQTKIQEELFKLESEWGDTLYEHIENDIIESIDTCKAAYKIRASDLYCPTEFYVDLREEELKYTYENKIAFKEASLKAIRRNKKLLKLSGMLEKTCDVFIEIDECAYNFIYTEEFINKPTHEPFKGTELYAKLLKIRERYEKFMLEYNKKKESESCKHKPAVSKQDDQQITSQEALWLLWLVGSIIVGLILIFTFK